MISIRMGPIADPDTGESCLGLFLNEKAVPFWVHPSVLKQYALKAKENEEAVLATFLTLFLKQVGTCLNRTVSLSEILEAIKNGEIEPGPSPGN